MPTQPIHIGYNHFFTCLEGPMAKPGAGRRGSVMAIFFFDADLAPLFPYINADLPGAQLHEKPSHVRFCMEGVHGVLYADRCMASPFEDRLEAASFRDAMMARLNDIASRRESISPRHRIFNRALVPDILRLLPLTNCGACGESTCLAFAAMLSMQKAVPSHCPHLGPPIQETVTYAVKDACGHPVGALTLDVDGDGAAASEAKERFEESRSAANARLLSSLSPREVEVLVLLGKGHTNPEISKRLAISAHTVKSHVIHLFNKLGVSDRTQAAVWAAKQDLV